MTSDKTVLLAAGQPDPTNVANNDPWGIARAADDAVVSLVRAAGFLHMRLALEFDPSISAMVAQIAGQYIRPMEVEGDSRQTLSGAPVDIYFTGESREALRADEQMATLGFAKLKPISSRRSGKALARLSRSQRELNLRRMREALIDEMAPSALVVIGGGTAAKALADVFSVRLPYRTIYVFETTGGAATQLARSRADASLGPQLPRVRAFDTEYDNEHRKTLFADLPAGEDGERSEALAMPYAFLMVQLLRENTRARKRDARPPHRGRLATRHRAPDRPVASALQGASHGSPSHSMALEPHELAAHLVPPVY